MSKKIKGNVIEKVSETEARVNLFGDDCKVHLRCLTIGHTTDKAITMENSAITGKGSVEHSNGEVELVDL